MTYIFYDEVDGQMEIQFEIEADSYDEAYDKAFELWGPQVHDFYYKLKTEVDK